MRWPPQAEIIKLYQNSCHSERSEEFPLYIPDEITKKLDNIEPNAYTEVKKVKKVKKI